MARKHMQVVIVGGGFGGVKLARSLANYEGISMTLISDNMDFRYSPALYRTATGHRNRESSVPLKALLGDIKNLHLVRARAKHIDRAKRTITTAGGTKFNYDYAVLSLGVVTSYFGIEGLEKFAYGIKSITEVNHLRAHLHQELVSSNSLDKNYIVVGGGPTGVELASALRYYLTRMAKRHHLKRNKVNIELIEATDRLLPASTKRVSRLTRRRLRRLGVKVLTSCRVLKETDDSLLAGNRSIPTKTVIWTAGVTNNPFFGDNASQFIINERKKVVVDGYLRVDEHTFVIGDNAATPYSGLALTAIHNAKYVGRYLKSTVHDKTIPAYHPFQPISAVPVGPRWAVVQWGNFTVGGWVGGIIRLFADLVGYSDVMGLWPALKLWLKRYRYEDKCSVCKALSLEDIMHE